ncbi:MAG: DUF3037 domain-containing protein [Myxococcales bacterium]|nr:DUF3037 domain-containing protein [Myxococcales bacterium]
MPSDDRASSPFDYAVIRVVPRIERDEFTNVGVIVFARTRGFLGCLVDADAAVAARVHALAPAADLAAPLAQLRAIAAVCRGDPDAGPVAALPAPERFQWLVAPRSTGVQCSVIHAGTCTDPAATLARLFTTLVAR